MEVAESHKGAETMPGEVPIYQCQSSRPSLRVRPTINDQYFQALFDGERGVEHDKAETERQHIVTRAYFEEVSDCFLEEKED